MADVENMRLIPLTQGKFAIVDENNFEWLNQWKWYFHDGYAVKNISLERCCSCKVIKRKTVRMHREVFGNTHEKLEIDHINRNKIDNRRSNLRAVTRSQNLYNSKKENRLYSIYKGVTKSKRGKPFCSQINLNGKTIWIGSFNSETEAAIAYNIKAKELYGEYAYINHIED